MSIAGFLHLPICWRASSTPSSTRRGLRGVRDIKLPAATLAVWQAIQQAKPAGRRFRFIS